jgi:hypothetical protein
MDKNPIHVQRFLNGVTYPTNKGDLLQAARKENAPQAVLETLHNMYQEEFDSPADLTRALANDT